MPWTNSTERYCADAYLGYCLDYATRVTRRGVGPTVLQVVGLYDVPGASEERAAAQRSSESYLVDPSNAKEKTTALAEAVTMIKEFPAEQRMTALATWADLRTTREQERRAKIANAEATAAAERARATETRIEREEARREARRNAILGAGGALSSLFVIGLILAVLAIERNTRLLHAIHASDARRPGAA